jgi:aminoglycoside 6'-N-acetyltransferase
MAEVYGFRGATLADLTLLRRWMAEPHVRVWWGEDDPYNADDLDDPRTSFRIVESQGVPFAFMQDYDVKAWEAHHFGYLPEGARGMDQFIGVPDMLGHGHGTALIAQRMRQLLAEGAPVIGTDPHPANARAIAVYQKVGFRIAGPEEDTPWGRVIRMEYWPCWA